MDSDEEATRKAFEQFMISGDTQNSAGGKKKKKKKRKNESNTPTKSPPSHKPPPRPQGGREQQALVSRRHHALAKNAERQYWRIYRTFCDIVKNDWIDTDDQLEDVVGSIANIRGRLPMETHSLSEFSERESKSWAGHGYNAFTHGGRDTLTREDVELALAHDLTRHEKMLAALRSLMFSLSECQDTLGRQVDEMMLHHAGTAETVSQRKEDGAVDGETSLATHVTILVDEMNGIFSMLAMELFRKQSLTQSLLDSVTNDMLEGGRDTEGYLVEQIDEGEDISSRKAALRCCREWPRRSKHSCIDLEVLNAALHRCERSESKLE